MTDYNEEIDEFAPATPDPLQPATDAQANEPALDAPEAEPKTESVPAYDSIISSQNEQIAALIAQNQSLTAQITQLIQSGAQINANAFAMQQQMMQPSLQDSDEWSLESLAKDIGKRNR